MGRRLIIPPTHHQSIAHLQSSYTAANPATITLPHLTFLSRPLYPWERRELLANPPSQSRSRSTSPRKSSILGVQS